MHFQRRKLSHGVKKQDLSRNLGFSSHSGSRLLKQETSERVRWKISVASVSFFDLTTEAEEAGASRKEKAGSEPGMLGRS